MPQQHGADGRFGAAIGLGHRRTIGLDLHREVGAKQRRDHRIGRARGFQRGGKLRGLMGWRHSCGYVDTWQRPSATSATVTAHGQPPQQDHHPHRRRPAPQAWATAAASPRTARASRPSAPSMNSTAPSACCAALPGLPADIAKLLLAIQHDLFDLGGELAVPGYTALAEHACRSAGRRGGAVQRRPCRR